MKSNSWFHPNLSGPEAKKLLLEQGQCGDFLVRPSSSSPEDFTITIRRKSDVTNIKINNNGDCYSIGSGVADGFATLSELIMYFANNDLDGPRLKERHGDIIELKHPFPCKESFHHRCFHGNITGEMAEKILLERGEMGSYLLRNSQSNPDKIVLSVRRSNDKITHIYVTNQNGEFAIGEGPKIGDLSEFLLFYEKHCMVEYDGSDILLKHAINTTTFKAGDITNYIANLTKNKQKDGLREEFECLQKQIAKNVAPRKEGVKAINKSKNRYKNILPFDSTRVILKSAKHNENPDMAQPLDNGQSTEEGTDYINANYIMPEEVLPGLDKMPKPNQTWYIAAQGPLPDTINDFWLMVWQQDVPIIVMVTREVEGGRNKCAKYWPEKGICAVYGQFRVQNITETPIGPPTQTNDGECDVVRELYLYPKDKFEKGRIVYNFHCRSWPDHEIPYDPHRILALLDAIKCTKATLTTSPTATFHHTSLTLNGSSQALHQNGTALGPLLVHCSAGIGRAGTFIAIDILLSKLAHSGLDAELDVSKVIQWIRTQRSGLVQTAQQYTFIYDVLAESVNKLKQKS